MCLTPFAKEHAIALLMRERSAVLRRGYEAATEADINGSKIRLQEINDTARALGWCVTMNRAKSLCGCPDCGRCLVDVPEGA